MYKSLTTQIVLLPVVSLLLFISPAVLADSGQYGQYGQYGQPAPVQSILVDKQVSKPMSKSKGGTLQYEYVDNLTPSDVRFQPGMDIYFRIRVKNTSNITLNDIIVTDKVPSYLEPIEGPGNYDSNARTVAFNAGSLAAGDERTFNLKMQWFAQDKLPADRGLLCVTNSVRAYTSSASDEDTAQACVEKQVIGVKAAPKAGPEMNVLLMLGQLGILGIGLKLKKKADMTYNK